MKRLFANKALTGLLIGYGLIQLSSMFVRSPAILLAYELSYLAAMVVGIIWSIKKSKKDKDLKTFGATILLFLLINATLFLIYVPTLLLNPSINWALEGRSESDPMLLLAFWPPIHFVTALIIFGLIGLITRLTFKKEIEKDLLNNGE
jgi:hypothetical protein